MKKFLSLCLFALMAWTALPSQPAVAAGNTDLVSFFRAFEGHWSGRGSLRELRFDGSQLVTGLDLELRVDETARDSDWIAKNRVRTDSGLVSEARTGFSVRGDTLLVHTEVMTVPAQIVYSDAFSLSYLIRRADYFTGQVYDHHFELTLDPWALTFQAHNTVELNGVVIAEETHDARRR